MRWVLSLVCVAGCDLVFTPTIDDRDARARDGAVDDAPVDAMLGPFSPPVLVDTGLLLSTGMFIADPCLSDGESKLAFSLNGGVDQSDIYIARSTPSPIEWTAPAKANISLPARSETNPKLAPDGTVLWYAVTSLGSLALIRAGTYDAGSDTWVDATTAETTGLNTSDDDRPGTPNKVLDRMIVHRKTATGLPSLVEYARPGPGEAWAIVPGTVDELNALGPAVNAHLVDDGRLVVFSSGPATGSRELYMAARATLDDPFTLPIELVELNRGDTDDADPWLSSDGRRIWFSRSGGTLPMAEWGIYYSSRQ